MTPSSVLIDDLLAEFYVAADGDPPILPMKAVMPGAADVPTGDAVEIPPHDPERLVILQYTSGSTSEPKGVMDPRLGAQREHRRRGGGRRADPCWMDGVVVVPLYHDMGLVGSRVAR